MQKDFDLVVFIGRFAPLHAVHCDVINYAYTQTDTVLCLIGSANSPRSSRNPWTALERADMLEAVYPDIQVDYLNDTVYDYEWVQNVNETINTGLYYKGITNTSAAKVALIGNSKDASSYYFKLFPNLTLIDFESDQVCSDTGVRDFLFLKNLNVKEHYYIPEIVADQISEHLNLGILDAVKAEAIEVDRIKQLEAGYPYAINHVTVDALVYHPSGKILVVKRGGLVGSGLLALPGGYLDRDETILEGCVRELHEETGINLLPGELRETLDIDTVMDRNHSILKNAVKHVEVFDSPNRARAGRLITHVHLMVLDTPYLPTVRGSDDAQSAMWIDANIESDDFVLFHDDHAHIITKMLSKL